VTRFPVHEARLIQHILRMRTCLTSGFLRYCFKDDEAKLAALDGSDKAIQVLVDRWQRLIDAGNEQALIKALDDYYAAQAKVEREEELEKARRLLREAGELP